MDDLWRQDYKVVIVGGGIGGLATAIGMKLEGIQVEVLEASPILQEVGAGIEIPPNASRILYAFGLKSALEPLVLKGSAILMRSWKSGKVLSKTPLGPQLEDRYGAPHMHIHRADLLSVLAERAAEVGVVMRLGSAVSSITFPSQESIDDRKNAQNLKLDGRKLDAAKTILLLENGDSVIADCVIGADGQRSKCRELLTGVSDPLRRSGDLTYRVTIPAEVLRQNPQLREFADPPDVNAWLGPHGHVVAYPVRRDDLFNVFLGGPDDQHGSSGPIPPPAVVSSEEAKEMIRDWDPRLRMMLDECSALLKWTLVVQDDVEVWTHPSGQMTLMGDAAHAMLPYMGQGAAQALEDAATLSILLGQCRSKPDLAEVFRVYEEIRRPRASNIKERAWQMRDVVALPDGPRQEARDRAMAQEPFDGCPNPTVDPVLQKWLWGHDAGAVAREAWEANVAKDL